MKPVTPHQYDDFESAIPQLLKLFRRTADEDQHFGWDRSEQVRVSAARLEHLRASWPDMWAAVRDSLEVTQLNAPAYRGIREFKLRILDEIRQADESADYRHTVAFVSRGVLREIYEQAGQPGRAVKKFKRGRLWANSFAHEHGVPVSAILKIVLDPRNDAKPLEPVLDALSCRSLLLKTSEADVIDREYKLTLPPQVKFALGPMPTLGIPPKFYPLARYQAAIPNLVGELFPVSRWSAELKARFLQFATARRPDELASMWAAARATNFSVPDSVLRPPMTPLVARERRIAAADRET